MLVGGGVPLGDRRIDRVGLAVKPAVRIEVGGPLVVIVDVAGIFERELQDGPRHHQRVGIDIVGCHPVVDPLAQDLGVDVRLEPGETLVADEGGSVVRLRVNLVLLDAHHGVVGAEVEVDGGVAPAAGAVDGAVSQAHFGGAGVKGVEAAALGALLHRVGVEIDAVELGGEEFRAVQRFAVQVKQRLGEILREVDDQRVAAGIEHDSLADQTGLAVGQRNGVAVNVGRIKLDVQLVDIDVLRNGGLVLVEHLAAFGRQADIHILEDRILAPDDRVIGRGEGQGGAYVDRAVVGGGEGTDGDRAADGGLQAVRIFLTHREIDIYRVDGDVLVGGDIGSPQRRIGRDAGGCEKSEGRKGRRKEESIYSCHLQRILCRRTGCTV